MCIRDRGTFGKMVLFFCPVLVNTEDQVDRQATLTHTSEMFDNCEQETSRITAGKTINYELKREIQFKHSILGLSPTLLSNNGAQDLVILTLNGVSVWQYDPDKIIELIHARLDQKEVSSSTKADF